MLDERELIVAILQYIEVECAFKIQRNTRGWLSLLTYIMWRFLQ